MLASLLGQANPLGQCRQAHKARQERGPDAPAGTSPGNRLAPGAQGTPGATTGGGRGGGEYAVRLTLRHWRPVCADWRREYGRALMAVYAVVMDATQRQTP